MMPKPNVKITLEKSDLKVSVSAPHIVAEVRNYNVPERDDTVAERLIDENGYAYLRYFVSKKGRENTPNVVVSDLRRFTDDLNEYSGIEATLAFDSDPNGLHTLTIDKVDYFFRADNGMYDGWGRAIE